MTTLREAAQQALETLEALQGGCTDSDDGTVEAITVWCPEVIDDLRAALAEPEPPPEAQTEAEKMAYCAGWWDAMAKARKAEPVQQGCEHCNHPLYAAVKCRVCGRVTEPVQEPVAWLFTNLQSGDYDFCYCEDEHAHDREMWHKLPLYTAPPQRKPLTEEEIKECERQAMVNGSLPFEQRVFFARAIERKHEITP